MSDFDESTFYVGFVSKKEILMRLEHFGIMTEENLKPIANFRDSQFLNEDKVYFYDKLFNKCREEKEKEENDSVYSEDDDLELNDTLSEMEGLFLQGSEYVLGETPSKLQTNEFSFSPQISSTVTNLNYLNVPQNSLLTNFTINNSSVLKNISNISQDNSTTIFVNDYKLQSRSFNKSLENLQVSDKNDKKTPLKSKFSSENDICSPDILSTPQNYTEISSNKTTYSNKINSSGERNKVKLFPSTSKSSKENYVPKSAQKSKEFFKTPLPKTTPNYKNIVSPISRYISESPTCPLLRKIALKTIPNFEHQIKTKKKTKIFAFLPKVNYEPSKKQQLTYEEKAKPLPKNIDKYILKPLRGEIIKHKGRVNVENKYEESCEIIKIKSKIEDCSMLIDLETSRFIEMSVLISSEAQFSSELS